MGASGRDGGIGDRVVAAAVDLGLCLLGHTFGTLLDVLCLAQRVLLCLASPGSAKPKQDSLLYLVALPLPVGPHVIWGISKNLKPESKMQNETLTFEKKNHIFYQYN
jgi:hypothetical protein